MRAQAVGGWARLAHAIPVLADFPAMDVPFAAAEAPAFPPLGWQQPAARTAVMALAGIGTWLQVRVPLWTHSCCPETLQVCFHQERRQLPTWEIMSMASAAVLQGPEQSQCDKIRKHD